MLTINPIVCAAIRLKDGLIVAGVRHYDSVMRMTLQDIPEHQLENAEQGFIDSFCNFLNREEAYIVAKANGQIKSKTGNPNSKQLFSEDLY